MKLFTKRSQLREPAARKRIYDAAPWWEQRILDGGEKVVRSGKGEVQLSGYPSRFMNSLIVADHLDRSGRVDGHDHRLRLFALQGAGRG